MRFLDFLPHTAQLHVAPATLAGLAVLIAIILMAPSCPVSTTAGMLGGRLTRMTTGRTTVVGSH